MSRKIHMHDVLAVRTDGHIVVLQKTLERLRFVHPKNARSGKRSQRLTNSRMGFHR